MKGKQMTGMAVAWMALFTATLLAGALLTGCSMDRWAEVEAGRYVVVRDQGATSIAVREVQGLEIDRASGRMVFTLVDGSEIATSFVSRDRVEWPAGCPANLQSTRMEVLEIAEDALSLGSTTFDQPVLVRDCPPDPVRLVLREDGEIRGSGTACPHGEMCLYFLPESSVQAAAEPLPRSSKGYELYSWRAGHGWQFALMTGTNRLKAYEEIVSAETIVTESEWVALSVHGTEELKVLLGRLPKSEMVTWRGGGWLERAAVPKGNLELPGPDVIEEVRRTCRGLGIELQVAD